MSASGKALPLLAGAAVAAAIGCGGGSDEVSAEELVQQGDEICREVADGFAEIQAQPPANAREGAEQADGLLGVAEDGQERLREMDPPEELSDPYDRYLEARDEVSDLLEQGKQAAEDQDGAAYGEAQEKAVSAAPERRRLARELGFQVCSQRGAAP
jgi:pyruvate/2-oxoglutarate dehydrogenase complex dihydrolipoamide acyltransferase (E2) component